MYFLLQPFIGDSGIDRREGSVKGRKGLVASLGGGGGSWRWRLAVLLSQDGRQDRHELVPSFVDLSRELGGEACGQGDQQTVGQELRKRERSFSDQ